MIGIELEINATASEENLHDKIVFEVSSKKI